MRNETELRSRNSSSAQAKHAQHFLIALFIFQLIFPSWAFAELPVEVAGFNEPGVEIVRSADELNMTINQQVDRAYLNWETFNIGVDNSVTFNQLSSTSVALNKIHDVNPSQILGNLSANGQVYLLNGSGIIFGENATVSVASLVATTLDIDEEVFRNSSINAQFSDGTFGSDSGGDIDRAALFAGEDSVDGALIHNKGTIIAESGGSILIAAPNVVNEGEIKNEEGQTILAGVNDRLYLFPSDASELRGFIVELGGDGGQVSNEAAGKILSERGNITLLASAVHQKGEIRSTTDSTANGSIFLLGRDHADNFASVNSEPRFQPLSASADTDDDLENVVRLYEDSITEIELELAQSDSAPDAVEQLSSRIDIEGKKVFLEDNARVIAKSGEVNIVAAERGVARNLTAGGELTFQLQEVSDRPVDLEDTRVFIDEEVVIDVSGADVNLNVADNLISVDLFSNELRDSPLQRDGVLRGETIVIDRREGTPLADVSSFLDNQQKSLGERSVEGGDVRIWSDGDLILKEGASIDISGGTISYAEGYLNTTKLLSQQGVVDIADADPNLTYTGILGFENGEGRGISVLEQGYQEGYDAGTVNFAAHAMVLQGDVTANTTVGVFQQNLLDQPQGGTVKIGLDSDDYLNLSTNGQPRIDFRAPTLILAEGTGLPNRLRSDQALDALDQEVLRLNSLWTNSGVKNFDLKSNGEILIGEPENGSDALNLPGNVNVNAEALAISVNQSISSASGSLSLVSNANTRASSDLSAIYFEDPNQVSQIEIADGVDIDLSGVWSNDYLNFIRNGARGTNPIFTNGGSFSAEANKVTFGDNVSIDVSASTHVNEQGDFEYADAGSISIESSDELEQFRLGSGFSVQGFSYGSGKGGSFSLTVPSLIFSDTQHQAGAGSLSTYLHTFSDDAATVNENLVTVIASDFLKQGGFQSYDLKATSSRSFGYHHDEIDFDALGLDFALESSLAGNTVSGDLLFTNNFEGGAIERQSLVFPAQIGSPQLDEVPTTRIEAGYLDIRSITSESTADSLAQVGYLSDKNRGGNQLSVQLGVDNPNTESRNTLFVDQSVNLQLESDSETSLSLNNTTAGIINFEGQVIAKGGQVDIDLSRSPRDIFENDSYIFLSENAVIDVSSVFERDHSDRLFFSGETIDAGAINLSSSGYIVGHSGAELIADGSVKSVSAKGIQAPGQAAGSQVLQIGEAGTLSLNADEGNFYFGGFSVQEGHALSEGGTINYSTDAGTSPSTDPGVPAPARVDSVYLTSTTGAITENGSLADTISSLVNDQNGRHEISTAQIEQSGAANLSISAGELVLTNGVDLALDGQAKFGVDKIRSEVEEGFGNNARFTESIHAGYLSLGNETFTGRDTATDPHQRIENFHSLDLRGDFVDINGQLSIQGYSDVQIASGTDIRLNQDQNTFSQLRGPGHLKVSGDLTLTADRIYGSTNTAFDIFAGNKGDSEFDTSRISLESNQRGLDAPIYSANTDISFNAEDIDVNTTVSAPFGSLAFNAQEIQFDATGAPVRGELGEFDLSRNGVLLTNASGERIPFGYTINGRDWYYDFRGATNLEDAIQVFTNDEANFPTSNISIVANKARFSEQSEIDISRSGDLFAVEFISGTGGSADYLAEAGDNRFAIIPDYDVPYAAFDQRISEGTNIAVGSQIVIEGGSIIPAGTYTLLPAEYAHVEGAYIVEAFPNNGPIIPNQNQRLVDGTPLVAGYFKDAFTGAISNEYVAVSVRPSSDANLFSEYEISNLSEFAPIAFERTDVTIPGTVFDAGSLSLFVDNELDFGANLSGEALNAEGELASIDISASNIVVGTQESSIFDTSTLFLSDEQLSALSSGSLLLGGTRSKDVDEQGRQITEIVTTAESVSFIDGASVAGTEILISAKESITLEQDAAISSVAEAIDQSSIYQLDGEASILGVSNRSIGAVERLGDAGDRSSIMLSNSSSVNAFSIVADASGSLMLDASLSTSGGDVVLGAETLGLGSLSGDGLSGIRADALSGLAADSRLSLRSSENLVVSGFDANVSGDAANLVLSQLNINSSGISLALEGNEVSFDVGSLNIKGVSADSAPSSNVFTYSNDNSGQFEIKARQAQFSGSGFTTEGGESLTIDAGQSLLLSDSSALSFEGQSSLQVLANQVLVNTGADASIVSGSNLTLGQSLQSAENLGGEPIQVPTTVGGKLRVAAQNLAVNTSVQTNSGVIELHSEGDLEIGGAAHLDASGRVFNFFGNHVATDGGRISTISGGDLNFASGSELNVGVEQIDGLTFDTRGGLFEAITENGELSIAGLSLNGSGQGGGGSFLLDAQTLSASDSLSDALNQVSSSGFSESIDVRLRNVENAIVGESVSVEANNVSIASDRSLTVNGRLASLADESGTVSLFANDMLTFSETAQLVASGDDAKVRIDASAGSIGYQGDPSTLSNPIIQVGDESLLTLVAAQTADDLNISDGFGQIISQGSNARLHVLGANQTVLVGIDDNAVRVVDADIANIKTANGVWLQNSDDIKSRLNAQSSTIGVKSEILSANSIEFDAANEGDFAPAVLTDASNIGELVLRSEQSLSVNQSLSDGFRSGQAIPNDPDAYSFLLVAGADSSSSNATHVKRDISQQHTLTIGEGVHVRTSVGDISLATSGNLILANQESVVYTSGIDSGFALDQVDPNFIPPTDDTDANGIPIIYETDGLADYDPFRATPIDGGDLSIYAGNDIRYDPANVPSDSRVQLFGDWLITQQEQDFLPAGGRIRPGQPRDIVAPDLKAGLFIEYSKFNQGFASFGGGDLSMDVGGDLVRVSASAPTTIYNDGDTSTNPTGNESFFGEGDIDISVRGNVYSSDWLVGNGDAQLDVEGGVLTDRVVGNDVDAPSIIALMDGTFAIDANNEVELAAVLDPGFIDVGNPITGNSDESQRANGGGKFLTMGSNASLSLRSLAGDVTLSSDYQLFPNLLIDSPNTSQLPYLDNGNGFIPLPINTSIQSITNDIRIGTEDITSDISINFLNAANGSFELVAGRDVQIDEIINFVRLPNGPVNSGNQWDIADGISRVDFLPRNSSDLELLSSDDQIPSVILAGRTIEFDQKANSSFPEQVNLNAGEDIVINSILEVFHKGERSETNFAAGRNFQLDAGLTSPLRVIGPGRLNISAGSDVSLGVSDGIQTGAGTLDTEFYGGSQGADVSIMAGVNFNDIETTQFVSDYTGNSIQLLSVYSSFQQTVANEVSAENLSLSVNSLETAIEAYFQLPTNARQNVSRAITPVLPQTMSFDGFIRSSYTAVALSDFIQKPSFSDLLIQALQEDEIGNAILDQAIAAFSPLPTSVGLLQEYSLTERSQVVSFAYRALDQQGQLRVSESVFQDMSDREVDALGLNTLFTVLGSSGELANLAGNEGYDIGFEAIADVFPGITYEGNLRSSSDYSGDIDIFFSRVNTFDGGDINFLTPGGSVNGGVVQSPTGQEKRADQLGVVVQQSGDINAFMQQNYLVNQGRAFTLQNGNILMWASDGNIDAGRGAKTAVAIPPPRFELDNEGNLVLVASAAIAGSGIRQFASDSGCDATCRVQQALGVSDEITSVNLIAPNGEVNAGDAGIGAAGNINIAAQRVVGADNIDVGGVAVGVPVDAGGLSAGLSGLSSVASAATNAAAESATSQTGNSGYGDEALAWLEVFIVGYGEEEDELL